jgi:hypothetical protein
MMADWLERRWRWSRVCAHGIFQKNSRFQLMMLLFSGALCLLLSANDVTGAMLQNDPWCANG